MGNHSVVEVMIRGVVEARKEEVESFSKITEANESNRTGYGCKASRKRR
jgi:hypothetical protein